jgi:hypothetical protein
VRGGSELREREVKLDVNWRFQPDNGLETGWLGLNDSLRLVAWGRTLVECKAEAFDVQEERLQKGCGNDVRRP